MTLSLCMIVKNESETLDRCLSHARPYVDEIVIVDTGSTDGTQDIAKRYADVYDEIEWPNSFALARNHSFDLATGDFILVLDGDEYIEDEAGWKLIREVIEDEEVASAQLRVRNELGPGKLMAADRMWQERVFKNVPDLRYSGRVHNQIEASLHKYMVETGLRRVKRDVEVIHTGYALAADKMKDKYRPRLDLLRAEYAEATSSRYRAYYGYQLGVVLFILEELDEAHRVFGEIDYMALSEHNGFYTHLLAAHVALNVGDSERALIHCNAMLNLSRTEPIAYYSTGLALIHAGEPGDGMLMLLGACEVMEQAGASARFALNTAELLKNLAMICGRAGLENYARAFERMASDPNPNPADIQHVVNSLRYGIVTSGAAA